MDNTYRKEGPRQPRIGMLILVGALILFSALSATGSAHPVASAASSTVAAAAQQDAAEAQIRLDCHAGDPVHFVECIVRDVDAAVKKLVGSLDGDPYAHTVAETKCEWNWLSWHGYYWPSFEDWCMDNCPYTGCSHWARGVHQAPEGSFWPLQRGELWAGETLVDMCFPDDGYECATETPGGHLFPQVTAPPGVCVTFKAVSVMGDLQGTRTTHTIRGPWSHC